VPAARRGGPGRDRRPDGTRAAEGPRHPPRNLVRARRSDRRPGRGG
jgi:hypothetical protein